MSGKTEPQKLSHHKQAEWLKSDPQQPCVLISKLLVSLVAQSCPTLCDLMNCSIPGFPVHHQLLEHSQTHVHRVGDAIHQFHPLSSPSPAFNLSSIRVFSNESALCIRWPYWSFSFSISPSSEYSGLISFRINWFDLLAVQGTLESPFSNTTVQKHQFFDAQLSLWSNSHIHT